MMREDEFEVEKDSRERRPLGQKLVDISFPRYKSRRTGFEGRVGLRIGSNSSEDR